MEFCKSCGASLDEDSKVCGSCNTNLEQATKQETSALLEEEIHPHPQQESPQTSPKLLGKLQFLKKPVFIALILLLIGGGTTAAFLLKKSPKELYLFSEYNTIQKSITEVEDKYGDAMEFQQRVLEKPSQSEFTLSGDFSQDSAEGDPNYEMVRELLGATSIEAKTQQDPVSLQGHYALTLNVENEKAIDIEMYQSKEQIGIKVPTLYEKFLYLNLDQFGEFMRMIDPYYDGPETLESSNFKVQDLKLTEEESKYLSERYSKFLLDSLKDESFKLQKGVNYEHKGEQMKLRAVTLTLTEQELKTLLNNFMDQLIQDDKLHNMMIDRAEKVAEATNVTERGEPLDTKEMKTALVDSLKKMKEDLDSVDFPKGFKSTLLIDKKEQIVDRTMNLAVSADGEQINAVVSSKNVSYGNNKIWNEWKVEISPEEDGNQNSVVLQFTNDIQEQKESRTEKLQGSFAFEEYGESEEITFNMTSNFKGTNGKLKVNREFELGSSLPSYYDIPDAVKGEITQVSDVNLKKDYNAEKLSFNIDIEDNYDTVSFTLNLDSKTTLKDSLKFPKLTGDSNTGINVTGISEDEMITIGEEVGTNLYELGKKYGLIPEEESYYGYDDYYGSGYYE